MDRVLPLRRFASWLIDRLLFLGAGIAVVFVIRELGSPGPDSVDFDVRDFLTIHVPLGVLITYVLWFGVIIKFGPPGRRLTGTDVRRRRGGNASWWMKMIRATVKFLLHLTLIGFFVDAFFIMKDRNERRSIPDRVAGTVIARHRWR